jgi:DNA polymerase III psi subunit
MQNTPHLLLSDYQRAILDEMGISSWRMTDQDQTQVKIENPTFKPVVASTNVKSKEGALAKLKQLKAQTQTRETTDSVLVTFPQSDSKLQIFADILMALGLDAKQKKYVSTEQLDHYLNYPLSWSYGEKISFGDKLLITPALSELHHTAAKKQLWQQLQSILSIAKN